jgi:FKBP-type peptidyl-prolyl cis-trans isomerase SlpA
MSDINPYLTIQPGSEVVIHCSITLEDGTVAESTFGEEPLRFVMGDGTLLRNLELALYDRRIGTHETLNIDPEYAFGVRDEGAIVVQSRTDFPAEMMLEEGQIILFTTAEGEEVPGAIRAIEGDKVTVDYNHPLAGHEITFEYEVLEIHPGSMDDENT